MPGKGSPEFVELLKKCIDVHYKKNHDYASEDNPFSNFERAAVIVSWFTNPVDQVYAALVGIKLARAAELCNGTTPSNESLDDTFMDQTNYSGLWGAWHIKANAKSKVPSKEPTLTNIVCNTCARHFNNIMAIRTKHGNFCSNKCADEFESKEATLNKI
jgi:hypothetical protein